MWLCHTTRSRGRLAKPGSAIRNRTAISRLSITLSVEESTACSIVESARALPLSWQVGGHLTFGGMCYGRHRAVASHTHRRMQWLPTWALSDSPTHRTETFGSPGRAPTFLTAWEESPPE